MAKRLYVGNLSFATSEESLRDAFEEEGGRVTDVHIVKDRDTGNPRGFAFVEMSSEDEAQAALERWDGQELDGRPIRVNEAHDRQDGGGGSRGGRQDHSAGGW